MPYKGLVFCEQIVSIDERVDGKVGTRNRLKTHAASTTRKRALQQFGGRWIRHNTLWNMWVCPYLVIIPYSSIYHSYSMLVICGSELIHPFVPYSSIEFQHYITDSSSSIKVLARHSELKRHEDMTGVHRKLAQYKDLYQIMSFDFSPSLGSLLTIDSSTIVLLICTNTFESSNFSLSTSKLYNTSHALKPGSTNVPSLKCATITFKTILSNLGLKPDRK